MQLTRLLPILVLGTAGCATTYVPPQVPPPPLWDGAAGWVIDAHSLRVTEGVKQVGEVIVEHDAQLKRTGLITETVRLRTAYGSEMVLPEGTKVFATNYVLTTGPQRVAQKINPIEWCAVLPPGANPKKPGPPSVCVFWENEQRASYKEAPVGGFAFEPRLPLTGVAGPVPKIEEAPADFGVRFTQRLRVGAITDATVTLENIMSDGTTSSHAEPETYNWKPDGTLIYSLADEALVLTRSADLKTVDVRLRVPEPVEVAPGITEYTVVLDLLVGTHGLVKEARVLQSSGIADVDARAIRRAEYDMKLEGFMENGRRVEKRGRFPMKIRVEKK